MAASFGEQLRLAREARGITLRHISDQTRISMRYLEAIESDDYKRLPGGIFNRSFIKSYAKQIGFDEKEALEGYMRTAREQGEDEVATTPYKSHVYTDGGTRSPFVTLLLTVLILAILSLAVYAAVHWYQRREAARDGSNQQPANTQATQPANPTANQNPPTMPAAAFRNINITSRDKNIYISWLIDDAKRMSPGFLGPSKPVVGPLNPQERLVIRYDKTDASLLEITIDGHQVKKVPDDRIQIEITKENYEEFLR
jgi:cytoskeletal protein RodZ